MSKAELELIATLYRSSVFNNFSGPDHEMCDVTFFTCLPTAKTLNFISNQHLEAATMNFCQGLPINLSLSAHSAILFYNFSQSTASSQNQDDFG